jgi:L-lactate utilization protein LutB
MKKKINNLKSICCGAEAKVDMSPDFIGDNPKTMQIGTYCYVCTKCSQPCDIYSKERKLWNRNPATKIEKDKRSKLKEKLTKKEIREINE